MRILFNLFNDETGSILSAEAVAVGSVLLVGTSVGMNTVNKSIQSELSDFAAAIHELDQSYTIGEVQLDYGWSAGSSFQDDQTAAVEEVLETEDVCIQIEEELTEQSDSSENKTKDLDEIELKFSRQAADSF